MHTFFGWKTSREETTWKNLDAGVEIILEWVLGKYDGKVSGCIWLRIGTCEHSNTPLGSIKCREFD
jgi:hypothetical protein